jgi:hypothetical protein
MCYSADLRARSKYHNGTDGVVTSLPMLLSHPSEPKQPSLPATNANVDSPKKLVLPSCLCAMTNAFQAVLVIVVSSSCVRKRTQLMCGHTTARMPSSQILQLKPR